MKRTAGLSLLGIVLAVVLAFGVPVKANASDNSGGGLILAKDYGISIGEGGVSVGPSQEKTDRDQQYNRDRTYDRDREYDRSRAYDKDTDYNRDRNYDRSRDYERSREYDRDRSQRDYDQDRTYDMGGSPRF
jgi:hypothetical protein